MVPEELNTGKSSSFVQVAFKRIPLLWGKNFLEFFPPHHVHPTVGTLEVEPVNFNN